MYLDLDLFRGSHSRPLPPVVYNLLTSTGKNYFPAHQNQVTSKWHILTSGTTTTEVEFSHALVKSAENEWNIIENTTRGEGGFGTVRPSHSKIVVDKNKKKTELAPTQDVVKIQALPYSSGEKQKKIQAIHKEAEHQRNHYVNVKNVVTEDQQIFIITEDCGTSLDQLSFQNKPFDYCLQVALCILNEMIILEQKGVVHRDLKPQNICLKFTKNPSEFKVIFIDFGLADHLQGEKNKERSGTAYYMAPELFERNGQSSAASDIYALAGILGYVFGVSDVLSNKRKQANPLAPFYFHDLGQRLTIPADLETPTMIDDIKRILNEMQRKNPKDRPELNFINRFFIAIPQRRELYKQYQAELVSLQDEFHALEKAYRTAGLLKTAKTERTGFCPKLFHSQAKNIFQASFLQERTTILNALYAPLVARSHYEITRRLYEQHKSNSDYGSFNPFPSLEPVKKAIQNQNKQLEVLRKSFAITQEKLTSSLLEGSNSTGIVQIRKILRTDKSLFDKLSELQKIGQQKTDTYSLSNWYSRSSIFGKGRHEKIEELYQKLATLDKSSEEENLTNLNEINYLLSYGGSFTHG